MPPIACWLIAVVLLPLRVHQDAHALAAWLAPLFLMRFVRCQDSGWRATGGVVLAYLVGEMVAYRGGYLFFPIALQLGIALLTGVAMLPAYLLDRRWSGSDRRRATLVFPATMVAVEWLATSVGPFGSFGVLAYSQSQLLPLVQTASLFGLWGISFLIYWLAPAGQCLIQLSRPSASQSRHLLTFASVFLLTVVVGSLRLSAVDDGDRVRVGVVAQLPGEYEAALAGKSSIAIAKGDAALREEVRPALNAIVEHLFERSERAVDAGAQLLVWGEDTVILAEDERALLDRAQSLALRNQVHVLITPRTIASTRKFPYGRNRALLIDPKGDVLFDYEKAHPVIGLEDDRIAAGDGRMPVVDTALGRIGIAICFDADYPATIRQAGQKHVDLLLVPADDWKAIRWRHSEMARMRAVENGVNLVRSGNNGVLSAFDTLGRRLLLADTFDNADPVAVVEVPRVPRSTVYTVIGDVFAWLCAAAALLAAAWPRRT
jgi:apolipoprotein N-acyltransferase